MLSHALLFGLFFIGLLIVAAIPWSLLYGFSNIIALLFSKAIRYRHAVMKENLALAFPEKLEEERDEIIAKNYRNLADITVEALRGFFMSRQQVRKRHKIINPELLDAYYSKGQSVIGVAGHFNNWEWGALSAGLQIKHKPIALYKPLANPLIDSFMRWTRAKKGTVMASNAKTAEAFESTKNETCIYILIADQSPVDLEKAYWLTFLNQETACLHGPEKYASKYNYPVIYIDIQRVKRGQYEIHLSELATSPTELPEGALTEAYMRKLEESIKQTPHAWLWTHRRWKRTRKVKSA
ncbi:MAG: hypothetical protein JW783_12250 [Bacteroidales bacterium]|nr:hypothetical protein [Bacteroidales bacterium]MBN2748618.1 hypothetical protein [Bacteroidales bacterium]